MELLEIELSGEFNKYENECGFQAIFNEFVIQATIEVDFEIDEPKDEEVGIMSDNYQLNKVQFFNMGITDREEEVTYPGDTLLKAAKQEIENHFDKLVQNF
jgi:hypothetical protein